jgi:hypothetical protein
MSSDVSNEVSVAPAGADNTAALTSMQFESFKGFDNFSSIKSSMTDTSSSALPTLELFSAESSAAKTDDFGTSPAKSDSPIDPKAPVGVGQNTDGDLASKLDGANSNGQRRDDGRSKPDPNRNSDQYGPLQPRMPRQPRK